MKFFVGLAILLFSVFSCTKESPKGPDVYVSDKTRARYWKNGQSVELTSDFSIASTASTVFVSKGDIYVAGYQADNTSHVDVATYWKNGVPVSLLTPNQKSYAYSIWVLGSDVYLAGNEGTSNGFAIESWKNGIGTTLGSDQGGYGYSITVDGTNVYVAGNEHNSSAKSVAKFWKNGISTVLTDGSQDAEAFSIVVFGGDVYIAGHDGAVATYWKNGVAMPLTDGTYFATATSIAISGADVYVSGYEYNSYNNSAAKYWKNGVPFSLSKSEFSDDRANSIKVAKNGDVYVAGIIAPYATYWKNGVAVTLHDKDNYFTEATSIFLVE